MSEGVAPVVTTTELTPAPKVDEPVSASESRPRYRSWRKKFRKMKVRFDEVMKTNSTLFKEEQKLVNTAKRLQENNDQLLELLLDLNSSLAIPADLRFNLKHSPDWMDEQDIDVYAANKMLHEAYSAGESGRAAREQFPQMKENLETHVAARSARHDLRELAGRVPQPMDELMQNRAVEDIADPHGFLSSTHEEEYLDRVDAKHGDSILKIGSMRPATPPSFAKMTAREVERETELRNPLSVHNWLKKHGVTMSEGEEKSEAGGTAKKGNGRTLARKVGDKAVERARERDDGSPMSSVARGEGEEYDEEGYEDGSARARKSKGGGGGGGEDDGAYRPKGGKGGKPKRKREDVEPRGSSKKPKTSIGGPSDV